LCLLKKKDPDVKGEKRTIAWIVANCPGGRDNLGGAERSNGVKEKPLLDTIETCRYIVPPLHTMLGVANKLLTDFKDYVDELLENTPMELQILRTNEMRAEKEWWGTKIEVEHWTELNGPEIGSLVQAQKDIKEIIEYENEYGSASKEEIKDLKSELILLAGRIKILKAQQKIIAEDVKVKTKIWGACRKLVMAYCTDKNLKHYSKPVKSKLEKVLRKYGIDYAAYHGGELVGNDCRKLLGCAKLITEDLKEVLLLVVEEKGMSAATKLAVTDRCDGFCMHLFALILFFL
jgi:hypothetical protein